VCGRMNFKVKRLFIFSENSNATSSDPSGYIPFKDAGDLLLVDHKNSTEISLGLKNQKEFSENTVCRNSYKLQSF